MTIAFSYLVYNTLLFSVIFLTYYAAKRYKATSDDDAQYGIQILDGYSNLNAYHFLAIIFIAFIVGYRYKVGTDWDSYKLYFERGVFNEGKIEIGYRVINQIVFYLNGKYTFAFFIISFISWYFIFKGFPTLLLPLGIYFLFCDEWFFFSTNGVRQFMAFGFIFYATKYLSEKNIKRYLLWIFIAGLFHRTAWILSLLCLIPWNKLYNHKIWLSIYVVSFLFSQNATLLKIIPTAFKIVSEHISFLNIYQIYFESIFYNPDEVSLGNLGIVLRVIVTIYILYYSENVLTQYPKMKVYYVIFFLGSILTNIFIGIPILSRFTIYLTFFRPLLLALTVLFVLHQKKYKFSKIVTYSVVFVYFILYLYVISISLYDFSFLNN